MLCDFSGNWASLQCPAALGAAGAGALLQNPSQGKITLLSSALRIIIYTLKKKKTFVGFMWYNKNKDWFS